MKGGDNTVQDETNSGSAAFNDLRTECHKQGLYAPPLQCSRHRLGKDGLDSPAMWSTQHKRNVSKARLDLQSLFAIILPTAAKGKVGASIVVPFGTWELP
jgi:hypothetical protein